MTNRTMRLHDLSSFTGDRKESSMEVTSGNPLTRKMESDFTTIGR